MEEKVPVNQHLIKIELTASTYQTLLADHAWRDRQKFIERLPDYVIARCPFCQHENRERLDTYSVADWTRDVAGSCAFSDEVGLDHCEHFTLVEPFFHFHGIWPSEAKSLFGPEVPYVIGYLLESNQCLAVIHALPVCRIEENAFVLRYTLFLVTYFSEEPEQALEAIMEYNVEFIDEAYEPSPFLVEVGDDWDNLAKWVAEGKLYWLDSQDESLPLQTGDIGRFPYANITGRSFSHRFPYPIRQSQIP